MKAWHWLRDDMQAGHGREKVWTVGEERSVKAKNLVLCERGYHSSPSLFDALQYAPGSIACIVEISEPIEQDATKYVSRTRKLIAAVNVERELRQFAIDCATRALTRERDAGCEPDARSWAAIAAATDFLAGRIGQEELAAARDAAWDAARDAEDAARAAAWAAAWDAARDAAWDAARDAADAARAAAWAAARDAAWDAARDAEVEWQRQRFNELVLAALEAAVPA